MAQTTVAPAKPRQRRGSVSISIESPQEGQVSFLLKPFLQPFERELAFLEVKGLHGQPTRARSRHEPLWPTRLSYFLGGAHPGNEPVQARRELAGSLRADSTRILRFGPHGFHEYRGKFFPQLVRSLCNAAGLQPGERLLDPMCGSGTSLVEARALDLRAYGLDQNPLSRLLTTVKTEAIGWDKAVPTIIRSGLKRVNLVAVSDLPWNEADLTYLRRWFRPEALREIAGILADIDTLEAGRDFAAICLSNVVRRCSLQDERDLRVRKVPKPYRRGTARKLFLAEVERNLSSMERLLAVDSRHEAPFEVRAGDARDLESAFPRLRGRVDGVVTSPPYAMALPYLDTDRLSLIVLGLSSRSGHRELEGRMIGTREVAERERQAAWNTYLDRRSDLPGAVVALVDSLAQSFHGGRVGFRRRNLPALLSRYFLDMQQVFASVHAMLRPGAQAFVVVGTNSTNVGRTRVEIATDDLLMDVAIGEGFEAESPVNMEMLTSRDLFARNQSSREQILWLRKP